MISVVSEQERLQEIPTQSNGISEGNLYPGGQEAINALPGSELDHLQHPSSQVCYFIGCVHACYIFNWSSGRLF